MIFTPRKFKYKKCQKGSLPNKIKSFYSFQYCNKFPCLKLISLEFGILSTKQLTAIRFLIKKFTKKKGFLRFKIFPSHGVTKKPLEIRMGKGKGNFSHWVNKLQKGTVICEIFYKKKNKVLLIRGLKKIKMKIPINTTVKG
jgi:large subunit ribosomal protein L16